MKTSDAVAVLEALAHDNRLEIFRFLVTVGANGVPAGRIGEQLNMHSATLSFHLSTLKQAELVNARREGRSIIYTANFDRMNNVIAFLTANCCMGVQTRVCRVPGARRGNRLVETI